VSFYQRRAEKGRYQRTNSKKRFLKHQDVKNEPTSDGVLNRKGKSKWNFQMDHSLQDPKKKVGIDHLQKG